MKCVVYGLKNPTTNKIFYVGSSGSPTKRKYSHLSGNSNNLKNISSLRKANKKAIFEILEETDDSLLCEREIWWINKFISEGVRLENKSVQGNKNPSKLNKSFSFTTTKTIFTTLAEKASERKLSINQLLNNIAFSWVKKQNKK